jgi:hypothetical protein
MNHSSTFSRGGKAPLAVGKLTALSGSNPSGRFSFLRKGGYKMIEGTRIKLELAATVGRWAYLSCECFIQIGGGIISTLSYECAACRNTNLRFIHTLENMDTGQQILVGIECAALLVGLDEDHIPRLAENETKRKERWRREKYHTPGRCSTTVEDLENRGKL